MFPHVFGAPLWALFCCPKGGPSLFVRVKDKESGHEFDVPETDWRIGEGFFTVVKSDRYPRVDRPRPAKHNIQPIRASKKEES